MYPREIRISESMTVEASSRTLSLSLSSVCERKTSLPDNGLRRKNVSRGRNMGGLCAAGLRSAATSPEYGKSGSGCLQGRCASYLIVDAATKE